MDSAPLVGGHGPDLLPARMVNEFVYCPRLFWLEHVEREFEASFDTVDGERVHRRVDSPRGNLPTDATGWNSEATSVELSSAELGVVAKIDLVRGNGDAVIPIDFKRGKVPDTPEGVYDPERVQVCLQALLLLEHGYSCDVAQIYYAASKKNVDVMIDDALIAQTKTAVEEARALVKRMSIPAPLVNSPKCGRCSLHAICLPDEVNALRGDTATKNIRPFAALADTQVPLYVLEPGARVGLKGETLEIRTDVGIVAAMPLIEVGSISLFGNTQISSQAMRAVLSRDVPIFYLSYGGWLSGYARSIDDHSLDLRISQHAMANNAERRLRLSRAFVSGKVRNQRTMVRRSLGATRKDALQRLAFIIHRIDHARSCEELLGFEGVAARIYFDAYADMLGIATGFEITGRNRRPPTDPINAMLVVAALIAVGFEPGLGVYHRFRPGRPSLALDLMEEFRPLVVDSVVLSLINTKEIQASHFDRRGRAVVLAADGRRTFIGAIERRLRSSIIHPTFGYQVTYRRAINVQARLLARTMQGDIPDYRAFVTR